RLAWVGSGWRTIGSPGFRRRFAAAVAAFAKHSTGVSGLLVSGLSMPMIRTFSSTPFTLAWMVSPSTTCSTVAGMEWRRSAVELVARAVADDVGGALASGAALSPVKAMVGGAGLGVDVQAQPAVEIASATDVARTATEPRETLRIRAPS